jgi:hypothetical protein
MLCGLDVWLCASGATLLCEGAHNQVHTTIIQGAYSLPRLIHRKRGQSGLWYFLMLMSYSIFSAMLGSQSVLFGKSISVILRTTFSGDNQVSQPFRSIASTVLRTGLVGLLHRRCWCK